MLQTCLWNPIGLKIIICSSYVQYSWMWNRDYKLKSMLCSYIVIAFKSVMPNVNYGKSIIDVSTYIMTKNTKKSRSKTRPMSCHSLTIFLYASSAAIFETIECKYLEISWRFSLAGDGMLLLRSRSSGRSAETWMLPISFMVTFGSKVFTVE